MILQFNSVFSYNPRINGKTRSYVKAIKHNENDIINYIFNLPKVIDHIRNIYSECNDAVLVPVPKSTPLLDGDVIWPSLIIAEAVNSIISLPVERLIFRHTPSKKSATSGIGTRPTIADHLRTLLVDRLPTVNKIILVDDVITLGSTFAACAKILLSLNNDLDIKCFSLVAASYEATESDISLCKTSGQLDLDLDRPRIFSPKS